MSFQYFGIIHQDVENPETKATTAGPVQDASLTASTSVSGLCIGKTNSAAAAKVFMEDRLSGVKIYRESVNKGSNSSCSIRFSIS